MNNNQLSGCFPASLSAVCGSLASLGNNPGLPGGGNFGAFCLNGTGSCSASNTPPQPTANASLTATVGKGFSYTVNAFIDAETPSSLTYTASINPANGLNFDATTRVISGTPTTSGLSNVIIIATDPGGLSAFTSFSITYPLIILSIGSSRQDYGVYPNPISDQHFSVQLDEPKTALVRLYSLDGRLMPIQKIGQDVGSLQLKTERKLPTGVYILVVEERARTRQYRLVLE
ncbi:putative Ig domain-containing protein [Spirosoma endophyticum]|uniref:putative Ig domain-containing protein n=1 Tax=Spirosoma endophyticum TaxID=662367 RepID=UPI001FECCA43|nr:putative Ig domain-containing protein [Spirosoma endophyticum]